MTVPVTAGSEEHPGEPASPDSCARLLAALQKSSGNELCAACGALAARLSLTEARRAMAELSSSGRASVTVNGVCSVCGRRKDVVTR